MFKTDLPIIAAAGFAKRILPENSPVLDLNLEVVDPDAQFFEIFQNKVRRASRYVKYANLAALQCSKQIPKDFLSGNRIGLFLGTGVGNTPDTVKFTGEILQHYDSVVSPSTFINTVSNAGLFYAARALENNCTTTVISQETVSFEAALLTAAVMLENSELDIALVGGADVVEPPYEVSLHTIHSKNLRPEELGEGSAFLALARRELNPQNILGRLESVEVGMGSQTCEDRHSDYMAFGLDNEEVISPSLFAYRKWSGRYSTATAYGICRFLRDPNIPHGMSLFHKNEHFEGAYGYLRLTK